MHRQECVQAGKYVRVFLRNKLKDTLQKILQNITYDQVV